MPIIAGVTPRTVDVKINDAVQRQWKHVEDKPVIKFANIRFETGLLLRHKSINVWKWLILFLVSAYQFIFEK